MKSVAVIDYGMGNLHSVAKALEHVAPRTRVWVTSDAVKIRSADHIVLPGVGAIRDCMAAICHLGVDVIIAEVIGHKPLLGICVGLQALVQHSSGKRGGGQLPGSSAGVQLIVLAMATGWSPLDLKCHIWVGIR